MTRVMRITGVVIITAAVLCACPGEDAAARRAEERLKKAQAEKAERKKKSAELDAERQKARQGEPTLGPPYDDAKLLVPDSPCPKGTLDELKEDVFLVKLRGSDDLTVKAFENGALPIEVKGSMECTDATGRVTIAWTAPKPVALAVPVESAAAAKAWVDKNAGSLVARVVFRLSRADADGRTWRADLLAVRLSAGQDAAALAEKK